MKTFQIEKLKLSDAVAAFVAAANEINAHVPGEIEALGKAPNEREAQLRFGCDFADHAFSEAWRGVGISTAPFILDVCVEAADVRITLRIRNDDKGNEIEIVAWEDAAGPLARRAYGAALLPTLWVVDAIWPDRPTTTSACYDSALSAESTAADLRRQGALFANARRPGYVEYDDEHDVWVEREIVGFGAAVRREVIEYR